MSDTAQQNKPKHTPGPWKLHNGTYCGFDEVDLCTVYCTSRRPTEDGMGTNHVTIVASRDDIGMTEERQDANAALISAAPDIYRALSDILLCLGDTENGDVQGWWDERCPDPKDEEKVKQEVYDRALAALAKAGAA